MLRMATMPCSVLLVLGVECVAGGVALVLGIIYADLFRNVPSIQTRINIAILAYLWACVLGYLVTIPPMAFAIYRNSPGLLVPYLIWRLLLILGTIALGVMLGLLCQDETEIANSRLPGWFTWPVDLQDSLKYWVPPVVVQCALGLLFLIIVFLAFSRLNSRRARLARAARPKALPPAGANTRASYIAGNGTYGEVTGPQTPYPYAAYAYTMSDGAANGNATRQRPGRRSSSGPKHRRRASTGPSEMGADTMGTQGATMATATGAYPYAYPYYYGYYNYAAPAWRY